MERKLERSRQSRNGDGERPRVGHVGIFARHRRQAKICRTINIERQQRQQCAQRQDWNAIKMLGASTICVCVCVSLYRDWSSIFLLCARECVVIRFSRCAPECGKSRDIIERGKVKYATHIFYNNAAKGGNYIFDETTIKTIQVKLFHVFSQ